LCLIRIGLTDNRNYNGILGLILIALVGAPLSGWVSDKVMAKYRRERGSWYPEDRLRASLFGFFLPVTVIAPAVTTRYITGMLGLALNLLCFLINGVAVCPILSLFCGSIYVDASGW
jgi:hypothetical protein